MVLPHTKMNSPQAHRCSPSQALLPPPSPHHPTGSSQRTSPKHPVSCIEPGLATRFIYDIIHVSMPVSQSKSLLISWLHDVISITAVTVCSDFRAQKNKVSHCFHCFPIYLPWSDGTGCHDLSFLSFKPGFSLSSFTFMKRLFSSSSLSAIKVVSSAYLRLLTFLPVIWVPALLHPAQHFTWCTLHIS